MEIVRKSSTTIRIVAILLGIAFALSFVGATHVSAALTAADVAVICAIVGCDADQTAALNALVGGGSGGSCPVLSQPLTIGSQGQSVTDLQDYLTGTGHFTFSGGSTGYFGPITQSAVAAWQTANSVAPAAGYWGPVSLAAYNSVCTSGSGSDSDSDSGSTGLQGGAGSISDADYVSKLNNEEVGEGETDIEVAGLTLEADDGSDIEIVAANLNFSKGTADRNFDKYADEVSIWLDGKELARIDADQFKKDDNYDKTVTLSGGGVIDAGEEGDLVVAVSGVSNLDSGDTGETWTLEFESIRFRDASGAVITDTSTGDINDGTGRTFTFEDFATAADVELKFATGDDSINDARAIDVDDTNDTDNVDFFSFTIEAKGNSDVTIDDLPMLWVAAGAASPEVDEIINTAELWIDGDLVDSLSIPSAATTTSLLTFADFDYTISAGDKVDALVKVDINDIEGDFADGDTLSVTLGEDETDSPSFDAVDEEGNDLVDADKTGSASSDAHAFFDVGIQVAFVSASAVANPDEGGGDDNDVGTFTIVLDITAFGGTVYVGDTADATTAADGSTGSGVSTDAIVYRVYDSGTATTDDLADLVTFTTPSGVTDSTDNIKINEDKTSRVTLTVTQSNDSSEDDGIYFMDIAAVGFGVADDTTYEFMYVFDLDEFETSTINLN